MLTLYHLYCFVILQDWSLCSAHPRAKKKCSWPTTRLIFCESFNFGIFALRSTSNRFGIWISYEILTFNQVLYKFFNKWQKIPFALKIIKEHNSISFYTWILWKQFVAFTFIKMNANLTFVLTYSLPHSISMFYVILMVPTIQHMFPSIETSCRWPLHFNWLVFMW